MACAFRRDRSHGLQHPCGVLNPRFNAIQMAEIKPLTRLPTLVAPLSRRTNGFASNRRTRPTTFNVINCIEGRPIGHPVPHRAQRIAFAERHTLSATNEPSVGLEGPKIFLMDRSGSAHVCTVPMDTASVHLLKREITVNTPWIVRYCDGLSQQMVSQRRRTGHDHVAPFCPDILYEDRTSSRHCRLRWPLCRPPVSR